MLPVCCLEDDRGNVAVEIEHVPTIPRKQRLDTLSVPRQTDYRDDGPHRVPGLALRVSPSGVRSWIVMARRPGKSSSSRFKLGDLRDMTLTEARAAALDFKASLRDGIDPIARREQRRSDAAKAVSGQAAPSFQNLVDLFLRRHVSKLRASTQRDYSRVVGNLAAMWGGREPNDIVKEEIIDWLDQESDRAPASARLSFAVARKLFAFGLQRGLLKANPFLDVQPPSIPKSRDRWLTDDEIFAFWKATSEIHSLFSPAFRFLLVTGQRLNEVSGMTWDEVDLDAAEWTIPASRAKNGRSHTIDLPPLAMEIVSGQPRIGELVFGSGAKPLSGWSKAKAALDAKIRVNGRRIAPWRTHDLRRSVASPLAEMGTHPVVIEKLLNHASGAAGGLTAVYQRSDRRAERRAAMEAWGSRLETIVGRRPASNVVVLR
jgi:integrase